GCAADLVRKTARPLLEGDGRPQTGGVPVDAVLELGLGSDADRSVFDMTGFSLRLTNDANAVSQLHAQTADSTWQGISPNRIRGVTNGVHVPSWSGNAVVDMLGRSLGANLDDLDEESEVGAFWDRLADIPTAELWDTHQREKLELAIFARRRLRVQFARHGEAPGVLDALESALDPDILTIGFARRFATYKRAGLLFTDLDRLSRILWNADRPVQIVYAGKAHPADRPRRGRPGLGRRAGSLPAPRGGDRPTLLRPGRERAARSLGRPDAPVDGLHPVAVLDDADAPRLRREDVPPGGRDESADRGRPGRRSCAEAGAPQTPPPGGGRRRRDLNRPAAQRPMIASGADGGLDEGAVGDGTRVGSGRIRPSAGRIRAALHRQLVAVVDRRRAGERQQQEGGEAERGDVAGQ